MSPEAGRWVGHCCIDKETRLPAHFHPTALQQSTCNTLIQERPQQSSQCVFMVLDCLFAGFLRQGINEHANGNLPDEMPPRGGFILPENLVLAGLRFRRRCHYCRRCHCVLEFLQG